MPAARERALHEDTADPRAVWQATAGGLIDALVGLLFAPVTDPAPPTAAGGSPHE